MKILIIPDIHGSSHWKYNIEKYLEKVDRIIFLGDYINSFNKEEKGKNANNNLKQIIEFKKRHYEKVTLLIGNHDLAHCLFNQANNPQISGYEYYFVKTFNKTFFENKKYFQIAINIDNYIFSHAGFTKTWFNNAKKILDTPIEDPLDLANWMWKNDKCGWLDFNRRSIDIYGNDPIQGPLWCRPYTLIQDSYYNFQIVGHTEINSDKPFWVIKGNTNIIIVDSPSHNSYLILDTKDIEKTKQQCEVEIF